MPDWIGFVRAHLPGMRLHREREEEIIADLAQQLEDWYQEALAGGASEKEAEEFARRQIPDWETLEMQATIATAHQAEPEPPNQT